MGKQETERYTRDWEWSTLWSLGIGGGSVHAEKGTGKFISGTRRRTKKLLLER